MIRTSPMSEQHDLEGRDARITLPRLREVRDLLSSMPGSIYVYDLIRRDYVYLNREIPRNLGYTWDEFRKIGFGTIAHPDDRASLRSANERTEDLPDGEVFSFAYRARHKDGDYRWIAQHVIIVSRQSHGRARSFLGIVHDITDAKRADELLGEISRRTERDVHEEIGQRVTALKIGLESLTGDDDHRLTASLSGIVHELGQRIDRLAPELRFSELEDFGLVVALTNYAERFAKRTGLRADFQELGMNGARLPLAVEMTLYKVAHEALTNVYKHARANAATVVLNTSGEQVQLIIEDNSRGFDPEDTLSRRAGEQRAALREMRDHVCLIGGTIQIESSIHGGTSVFVRIPLAKT
jgi:PAS domain S-box-containing protein